MNLPLDAINIVVLSILAFVTIRDLITKFFKIPRDKKWSWFFYSENEKELLDYFLLKLGLGQSELSSAVKRQRESHYQRAKPEIQLIELISKYLIRNENKISFGERDRCYSNYYINTMSASHNNIDLSEMSDLVYQIIKPNLNINPDFILTPKVGNPTLAHRFAEDQKIICILVKNQTDHSWVSLNDHDPALHFEINFEGGANLTKKVRDNPKSTLTGVIIDCNSSTGSQLITTMRTFNEQLSKLKNHDSIFSIIQPISEAYVLFRPTPDEGIDEALSELNSKCIRYFDLNEELKDTLYRYCQNNKISELDYTRKKDRLFIINFVNMLMDYQLLKIPIDNSFYQKTNVASRTR